MNLKKKLPAKAIKKPSQTAKMVKPKKFMTKTKLTSFCKKYFTTKIMGVIGVFLVVGISPAIALSGNNNTPYSTSLFHEMSVDAVKKNQLASQMPLIDLAYGKLVRGTRDYNNGNYVLYLGTEACPHCAQFLFNNPSFSEGVSSMGSGPDQASWSNGDWGKAILFNQNLDVKIRPKFILYEDVPPISVKSDLYWTLPWNKFQSNADLSAGQVSGDYIRHDQSAINFRRIFDFATANFSFVKGAPTVIAYKNGIATEFVFNPEAPKPGEVNQTLTTFISAHYQS